MKHPYYLRPIGSIRPDQDQARAATCQRWTAICPAPITQLYLLEKHRRAVSIGRSPLGTMSLSIWQAGRVTIDCFRMSVQERERKSNRQKSFSPEKGGKEKDGIPRHPCDVPPVWTLHQAIIDGHFGSSTLGGDNSSAC